MKDSDFSGTYADFRQSLMPFASKVLSEIGTIPDFHDTTPEVRELAKDIKRVTESHLSSYQNPGEEKE